MRKLLFLFVLVLFAGCHKNTYTEGTYYTSISNNNYKIYFKAARSNSMEQVKDYLLYKSAQVSLDKGYKYFAVTVPEYGLLEDKDLKRDDICVRDTDNTYPYLCSIDIVATNHPGTDGNRYNSITVMNAVKDKYPNILTEIQR